MQVFGHLRDDVGVVCVPDNGLVLRRWASCVDDVMPGDRGARRPGLASFPISMTSFAVPATLETDHFPCAGEPPLGRSAFGRRLVQDPAAAGGTAATAGRLTEFTQGASVSGLAHGQLEHAAARAPFTRRLAAPMRDVRRHGTRWDEVGHSGDVVEPCRQRLQHQMYSRCWHDILLQQDRVAGDDNHLGEYDGGKADKDRQLLQDGTHIRALIKAAVWEFNGNMLAIKERYEVVNAPSRATTAQNVSRGAETSAATSWATGWASGT